MTTALTDAYLSTTYAFALPGGGEEGLRIGVRSEVLAALMVAEGVTSAAFITAWNPRSRATDEAENIAAQGRLLVALAREDAAIYFGEGRGDGGEWPPEPSFLALGLDFAAAGRLATAFEQTAIVFIGEDAVPRLCLGF